MDKPEIVALNKIDALDALAIAEKRRALAEESGQEVRLLSGATGQGVREIVRALYRAVSDLREEEMEQKKAAGWEP